MECKTLDKATLGLHEDWYGNNAAVCCPVCGKVFIVSGFINKGQRICPACLRSSARITNDGVTVEWPRQPEAKVLSRKELEGARRLDEFVNLVADGGAVDQGSVEQKLPKAETIAVIECDSKMVALAARKRPSAAYAEGISKKSGYHLAGDVPELGYVVVSPRHRGQRLAQEVVRKILVEFGNAGVFATTSHPKMKCVLANFGFRWVGNEWDSKRQGERLSLWVREAIR
jgi:predicted GNAT family N-acyltransferase